MGRRGQELAETFLTMVNTHDPELVEQFEAEGYVNHETLYFAEGREANRQFWRAFFAALPDVSASMEDLVIAGQSPGAAFEGQAAGWPRSSWRRYSALVAGIGDRVPGRWAAAC